MSFVKISPGVCGCGFMGKNHIRNYLKLNNIDFVYVYDINPEIFESDEYLKSVEDNIVILNTLEELKDAANVISICSPSEYHYKNLLELYNIDNFYLIEKPMFLEIEQYNSFKKMYPECNENIKCGYVERYNPTVKELLTVLDEVPTYMEFKRFNPSSKRIGGNIGLDLSIHDVDLMSYIVCNLFRKTSDLKCDVLNNKFSYSYKNNAIYIFELYIGRKFFEVNIATSRGSMKKMRQIYIETKSKTYTANLLTGEIEIVSKKDGDLYDHDGNVCTEEYETIIKRVSGDEPLYLELVEVIKSAKEYFGILGKPLITEEKNMPLDDYDMSEEYHKVLR